MKKITFFKFFICDKRSAISDLQNNGMTMVELMISFSILTVIIAVTFMSISTFSKNFTSTDATNQMKSCSQMAINKIGLRLSESKRIFQNTAADSAFLARLSDVGARLSGARLSLIEETGSFSPTDPGFTASSVGNSLFFVNTEFPEILENVLDSMGVSYTVRIDTYMFNYYYPSPTTSYTLGGVDGIRLLEWHSGQYADYKQLIAITNATKRSNTVQKIFANGVIYAWDPTATSPSSAFFILDAAGGITASSAHMIPKGSASEMTRFVKGVIWGRYNGGLSPNTGGSYNPGKTVPLYAAANGSFPAGFEVLITNPRSAHRILLRLVMAVEGPSNLLLAYENSVMVSARNLW